MAYEINYNDKRFTEVTSEKNAALKESDGLYDGMINSSDSYYQSQIDAANKWGDTQKQLQQEQTDFAVEKIEQQKDQAKKDYLKEQSAAYVDWQKQSNQYGSNAEKMASSGLAHSGYSESSQVSMYNTYQNRVATARESYNRAVLNYDNAIKDAQLQNNSALAEIAYNTLQKTLELSLQGFQYKNTLVLEKANKKAEINDRYYTRYQNVLSQINTENALAEQIRQYNESLAEQKRQFNETIALQKKNSGSSGSSRSSGSRSGGSSGGSYSTKKAKSVTSNTGGAVRSAASNKPKSQTIPPSEIMDLNYGPISEKEVKNLYKNNQITIATGKDGKEHLVRTSSAPTKINFSSPKASTIITMDRMFPGMKK